MSNSTQTLSEAKACLSLAIPLIAAQLAQSTTAFVDTIMMGWLGSHTIAAGGLGATTFNYCLLISTSVLSAVSPLVAQAYGGNSPKAVQRIVQQGLWLTVLFSVPIMLILWQSRSLLLWFGQDANTVEVTEVYLRPLTWGFFPALAISVLKSFISAISQPRLVMLITLFGTLLNIGGNYALMFGKFGFPELGLAGIGWASTLSLWSMLLALVVYVIWKPPLTDTSIFQGCQHLNLQILRELLRVGLPIGGLMAVEAGIFTIITLLIGHLGNTALAAHQIVQQLGAVLTYQIANGIALATTVRVGQLSGQQDRSGIQHAGRVGICISGICMSAFSLMFWLMPDPFIAFYLDTNDPANRQVMSLSRQLLGVAAVLQVVDGIQTTASGALRGVRDTQIPMIVGFLAYWCCGLPIGALLGMRFELGAIGFWWGLVIGLAIAAIVLARRFEIVVSRSKSLHFSNFLERNASNH
ncbi:MATE family efflux transporter [Leptolyngbya sp. AN03gr2]|uniref:MATE family efflux transporter n=1 Tax=unclassified Leptolyngbya TaxID=2650499 RepID=UPI003D31DEA1